MSKALTRAAMTGLVAALTTFGSVGAAAASPYPYRVHSTRVYSHHRHGYPAYSHGRYVYPAYSYPRHGYGYGYGYRRYAYPVYPGYPAYPAFPYAPYPAVPYYPRVYHPVDPGPGFYFGYPSGTISVGPYGGFSVGLHFGF